MAVCTSPLRLSSQQSTPVFSLESDLRSLSLNTQTPVAGQVCKLLLRWEVLVGNDLCGGFSVLPSEHLLLHSPLRFWSPPPFLPEKGFLSVQKHPPSLPPSRGTGPIWFPFNSSFLIAVSLPLYTEIIIVQSLSVSDSLQPHRLQHVRLLCPSPSPGVCLNSCPLSQ